MIRPHEPQNSLVLGPVVGGLAHDQAYLWGRASGEGILHAWIGFQPDLSDARLGGKSLALADSNGWAGVAPVHHLAPGTHYHYSLNLSATPPDPEAGPYPEFTTFPLPGQPHSFAFAFGSCFRPEGRDAGQTFTALDAQRQTDPLRFILLLGDQIYADASGHNGLNRVACSLDEYREVYRHTWSHPAFRRMLASLPAFMTLDDHEVDDDWTWTNATRTEAQIPIWDRIERWLRRTQRQEWRMPQERVQAALQAYWEHQGMHTRGLIHPPRLDESERYALTPEDPGSLAYAFNFGAAAFFVLDTRSRRIKSREQRVMLGEGQWQALEYWLLRVKDTFPVKFLVTSSSLLYNMAFDIPRDRWSGFPEEQNRLLSFLALHGIEGVYLLAGDLHSAHAVSAELYGPQGKPVRLWEFCSSPFEQKTNWLSRFTYTPLRGVPLKNQRVHFTVGQHNYGVVRVNYETGSRPEVRFEVYGREGVLLAQC